MDYEKNIIKQFNALSIFIIIYILPLILNFYYTGANLSGNNYQLEISYIENSNGLINHLLINFFSYLNIFTNPIFWFFISAFLTQKTIKWVNKD